MIRPCCDACLATSPLLLTPAAWDAKTKAGPWAHLCEPHMHRVGVREGATRLDGVAS